MQAHLPERPTFNDLTLTASRTAATISLLDATRGAAMRRLKWIDPVDEKARRLGLVMVRCTRCYGRTVTVDRNVNVRPCRCGGRGYWYSRLGSDIWWSPADVEALLE